MPSTTCHCGIELHAEDLDALVPIVLAHFEQTHPEFGLVEVNVRDYLEAEQRLSRATERLPHIGDVEVHEASGQRLDDILRFFDRDAFAGNPAWASCYCMCHHVRGGPVPEWSKRSAAQNRADLIARVRDGSTTGLLAYVDGNPAAWLNASPRAEFPEHRGQDAHPDHEVGAIVCFVVAPPYRRHGLAARLLDGACENFARRGFRIAQAYPRKQLRGDDAGAYHGPLALYLDAGFRQSAEADRFYVVEKPLGG
jgi:GNAT superfamily N-acetyltransferase